MQISIRELKVNPSYYIRQAEAGHAVWVTSHKRVVARLVAAPESIFQEDLGNIPNISWTGKKPHIRHKRLKIKGKPMSDTVLEMR